MKTCKGTKSLYGCDKELPDDSFKISSINPNTGAVYRRNICRQCEYKAIPKPVKPVNKPIDLISMRWL